MKESEKQKQISQAQNIAENGCLDLLCDECVLNPQCLLKDAVKESQALARGFLLGIEFEKGEL